jgi:hypothetical protein
VDEAYGRVSDNVLALMQNKLQTGVGVQRILLIGGAMRVAQIVQRVQADYKPAVLLAHPELANARGYRMRVLNTALEQGISVM